MSSTASEAATTCRAEAADTARRHAPNTELSRFAIVRLDSAARERADAAARCDLKTANLQSTRALIAERWIMPRLFLSAVATVLLAGAASAASVPDEDWGYVSVRKGAHMFW